MSADKAILLSDDATHNGWANSKALALTGVTEDIKDTADETFGRNPKTGKLNGILYEAADKVVRLAIPEWSSLQYQQATLEVIRIAHKFGITGMKDAGSPIPALAAYHEVEGFAP